MTNLSDDKKIGVVFKNRRVFDEHYVPYLFEYNAQNFIPKPPTQSSVRVMNEVLDFYAFTPEST